MRKIFLIASLCCIGSLLGAFKCGSGVSAIVYSDVPAQDESPIVRSTPEYDQRGQKASPLGDLGYEIADSLDVIINANASHPVEFAYPEKLAMLRANSNDTIYGSTWCYLSPQFGIPKSYVFWNDNDTISFNLGSFPDVKTAVRNTKIALSGAQYNPDELGYFVYYVIILKDGKFTIKSGVGNEKREYEVNY